MSLTDILSSAVSGLNAAQAGLRTVSNNISNVGVAGYARERVNLSTGVSGGQVSGVRIGEPERVADRFLELAAFRRQGEFGRADATNTYLDRLQSLLGQPGSASGLSARLDSITSSAIGMTGTQGSLQTVAAFTNNIQDALNSMQQLNGDVSGLRGDVESEVGYTVNQVNGLLKQIYDLNKSVAQLTGQGRSTSGVADQRMQAVEQLSSLVAVTVRDQPDGSVTIETQSGQVLLDKRLRQLNYPTAGNGVSQPVYPNIEVRYANADGSMGASTGDTLESSAVGGKLGGLLDVRDRALPQFSEQLGTLFGGLAQALNAVSNNGSTVPAPASMTGHNSGLVGTDRAGFTGRAQFAVTDASGTLLATTTVDFDALPANATIDDVVNQINAGLGGAATASFANGKFSIAASGAGNGVVVAQDPAAPSSRGGVGFSQFFGLNDVVTSDSSPLVPSGMIASDPAGFTTGQTAQMVLRDASGRMLAKYTLQPATGGTVGDLVNDLNASPLAGYGSFALDNDGRLQFTPSSSASGASISIPADSTDRMGTGVSFSSLFQVTGDSSGMGTAQVRQDILADPGKLPLAQFQTGMAVGGKVLGAGDNRNATAFVDGLAAPVDLGKNGTVTIDHFANSLLGNTGLQASQAQSQLTAATARRDDAVSRRDNFSGVNIDEELSQMVVLQNSYSAAARVISTANDMYDTLLQMMH